MSIDVKESNHFTIEQESTSASITGLTIGQMYIFLISNGSVQNDNPYYELITVTSGLTVVSSFQGTASYQSSVPPAFIMGKATANTVNFSLKKRWGGANIYYGIVS